MADVVVKVKKRDGKIALVLVEDCDSPVHAINLVDMRGYRTMTAWFREYTSYAQVSMEKRVKAGDFLEVI